MIVVVGDAGLDVVAQHDGPILHGGDVRTKVRFAGGGAGANTAMWLKAAGAEPTLVARIGDDAGGRLIRAELEAAGVRCALAVDPEATTCCVVVLVDNEGQRSMLPDRGANARFCADDVTDGALAGARHLHLSGYVLLDETSRPAGLAALAAAKRAGLTTSVDPQSAPLLADGAQFLDDVRGVDLLMPNAAELAALTGSGEPTAAKSLLDTVGEVVVTSGMEGASWVNADGVVSVPAEPAECVDSTGAGDAFDAGVLAAWLAGESRVDALRAGVRLGARAVRKVGAQP
ncbi:carbohydrate kinase family protein [Amycolatopsis magusensis]|uniref:Sugar/nucleoside kinase (Ribokinase family) n=1 Tax=Amycolatopsis magusensis TaxID=882444 RepID=A0ABS4Q2I4_9PSEU|nr:carbohydrate kinase family protein [Amycolatopsis magusensis]MBP2185886.1 sugar/nucleoside kinase (ribokinase family) [Amycolatopsis magusensis]